MHICFSDTFFFITSHMGKERGKKGQSHGNLVDLWYTPMIFITVNFQSLGTPEDGL